MNGEARFLGFAPDGRERWAADIPVDPLPPIAGGADPDSDDQIDATADDADHYSGDITNLEYIRVEDSTIVSFQVWGGLRFHNGAFPANGDSVTAAYIETYVYSADYDDPSCHIHAHDVASPDAFGTTPDIKNRPLTDAKAVWIASGIGTGWKQSPSLVDVVQELVDAYTVTAIAFILKGATVGFGVKLYFWAWDYDDHSLGAKLHLEWLSGVTPKVVEGTLVSSGELSVKVIKAPFEGAMAPAGALTPIRVWEKALAGALASTGKLHISSHRFVTTYGTYIEGIFTGRCTRPLHLDGAGNRYVVGNTSVTEKLKVYKSTNGGQDWSQAGADGVSCGSVDHIAGAQTVLDSQGVIHIIWANYDDQKVYYVTFDTGDNTWGAREEVATGIPANTGVGCSITVDGDDKPHVVYVDKPGSYQGIYYRNKIGESWSSPEEVYGASQTDEAQFPQMAIDGAGNFHVVFITPISGARTVKWRKRTSGSWGSVESVCSALVCTPSLCVNSADEPCFSVVAGSNDFRFARRSGVDTWDVQTPYTSEQWASANLAIWGDVYYVLGHTGSVPNTQGWAGKYEDGQWSELVEIEGTPYLPGDTQFERPQLRWGPNEPSSQRFEYVWWAEGFSPARDDICWGWVVYWWVPAEKELAGVMTSSGELTALIVQAKGLSGVLVSAGVLSREAHKMVVGQLVESGVLTKETYKTLVGVLASAGSLDAVKIKAMPSLSGALVSNGELSTQFIPGAVGHPTMRRWGGIPGMVYTGRGTW